jgi:hypothetical protein
MGGYPVHLVPRRRALARCTCGLQRFQCGTLAWHSISAEPSPLGGLPFQGPSSMATVTMLTGSRVTKEALLKSCHASYR